MRALNEQLSRAFSPCHTWGWKKSLVEIHARCGQHQKCFIFADTFYFDWKSWVLWRVQRQRKHHRPAKTWGQKAIFLFLCVCFCFAFQDDWNLRLEKNLRWWDFLFKQHHISEEGKVILSSFVPYRVVLRGQTVDREPYFDSTSRKNAKGPTRLWSFFKFHSNLCGVLYWAIFSCGKLLRRVLNEKREIY